MESINNEEIMRLIIQHLTDKGLTTVAKDIEKQTGVLMEDDSINSFRQFILQGQYEKLFLKQSENQCTQPVKNKKKGSKQSIFDKVTASLSNSKKQLILYYIYEQQYIELMQKGNNLEAIALLQKQLVPRSPFGKDKTNLFKLASMIMSNNQI